MVDIRYGRVNADSEGGSGGPLAFDTVERSNCVQILYMTARHRSRSRGHVMKLPRREVLNLAAGAALLPAAPVAAAETSHGQPSPQPGRRPLAERLAVYAEALRYDDLDAETVERVKTHVIDTL